MHLWSNQQCYRSLQVQLLDELESVYLHVKSNSMGLSCFFRIIVAIMHAAPHCHTVFNT